MNSKKLWLVLFILILVACTPAQATVEPTATAIPPTATPAPTPLPTLTPGYLNRNLTVDSLERSYVLYIPPNLDFSKPVPAIFMLHFFSGSGYQFQPSELKNMADEQGFIHIMPNGTGPINEGSWNAGLCCDPAVINNVDEANFMRQILSDLETVIQIDPKRIYAVGYSNGGMLAHRLACEMSDVFAAVASMAGSLVFDPCDPQEPVSVLHIHGLLDQDVPFEGGVMARAGVEIPSVMEGMEIWAQNNGCTEVSQVPREDSEVVHFSYTDCQSNSAVELYTLENHGHTWPADTPFPIHEVIMAFFEAHPRQ